MYQIFGTFKKKHYLCIRKNNLIIHLDLGATVIPRKIMNIKKETEKAIMVEVLYYFEFAPEGSFCSSLVRSRSVSRDTWFPKSQIRDGYPSDWICGKKAEEMANYYCPMNGQVICAKVSGIK